MIRRLLALHFWLVVLFLLAPLIFLVPISLGESQFLEFPPKQLSLKWYREFFQQESWMEALSLSFRVGLGATALSVIIGTLASVALVRGSFPGRGILTALFIAPLIVPTVVLALGLYMIFLRWQIVDNALALTLAHAVVALPYSILLVSSSLRSFDMTIERAARTMGAGPFKAFMLITTPHLAPSIFAAAVLSFFASFDELIITLFVSGGQQTLPVRIWNDLSLKIDPTVPAAAVMLTAVSALLMFAGEMVRRRNEAHNQTLNNAED
ncbi:ABC transporter permease [Rhodobacteraceae bacterium D3-12]|nr:ABC transporter permease [Rhodobacteraceae bacterium D3-12]